MTGRADVVVIGAGAMGSAAAWWLARRGHDVVLLEQFEAGHDRGSSHGATRIFRHAYDDAHYVRMAKEALPLWRELEADAGRTLLELTGGIDHGPAAVVESIAAALIGEGVAREVLRPSARPPTAGPACASTSSSCSTPRPAGASPAATVASLHDRAAAHGADVRFGVGPASFTVDASGDGVRVRAADDEWQARVAVVAAGAWVRRGGRRHRPRTDHGHPRAGPALHALVIRTTRGRASSTTGPTGPSCTACSRRARG